MKLQAILLLVYGALLFIGGIIGHLKAQSSTSLIVGSICAAIVIAAGVGMLKQQFYAYLLACTSVGAIAIFFAYRYWLTGKMMPAGIFTIISLGMFLLLLLMKRK